MTLVRIEPRLRGHAREIAHTLSHALARPGLTMPDGSVFLGLGSADLIRATDPRPHVVVLLRSPRHVVSALKKADPLDAIECAQVSHADVLLLLSWQDAKRIPHRSAPGLTVILGTADSHISSREGVLSWEPMDALLTTEVMKQNGDLADALRAAGVVIPTVDVDVLVDGVREALIVGNQRPHGSPLSPVISPGT